MMPPVRKESARPAMSMKSPYRRTPAKAAGRSKAKYLTPIAGTSQRVGSLTKQEKTQACLRARGWARNTLGRKKDASSPPRLLRMEPSCVIANNDDEEEEEEEEEEEQEDPERYRNGTDVTRAASVKMRKEGRTTLEYDILREQRTSRLTTESRKVPETAAFVGIPADETIKKEDIFYDAFEYLPTPPNVTMEDVTVEDVSNDEDDEIKKKSRKNKQTTSHAPLQIAYFQSQRIEPIFMWGLILCDIFIAHSQHLQHSRTLAWTARATTLPKLASESSRVVKN